MTLAEISDLTKKYADDRAVLQERVRRLNDEMESARRRLLPGIKSAVAAAKQSRLVLHDAVEESPALFVKPRSVILHTIKVGFEKAKGKLVFASAAAVVKSIKKVFPDRAEYLIKTDVKPVKKALNGMSAAELKKIGIEIEGAGDKVIIKPADSDVDKIVAALLDENKEDDNDQ